MVKCLNVFRKGVAAYFKKLVIENVGSAPIHRWGQKAGHQKIGLD